MPADRMEAAPVAPIVWDAEAGLATALLRCRRRPSFVNAAAALAAAARSGRGFEALYGLWCFLRHPPLPLRPADGAPAEADLRRLTEERNVDGWFTTAELRAMPDYRDLASLLPADAGFRPPALLRGPDFLIAGEYGEGKFLHFVRGDGFAQRIDLYARDRRVRHIHLVRPLGDGQVIVATGDRAKYLDLWRIGADGLAFERRLMRRLGGFTAGATVRGETWLGSDFAGRPNYLMRLSDRRRFFFPRPFRTHYAADLIPVGDSRLLIATSNLACLGLQRSLFLFDCETGQYHAA